MTASDDDGVMGYLQSHVDGSWSVVGSDGFAYDAELFHAMVESAKADSLEMSTVDVEALSVTDTEVGQPPRRVAESESGSAETCGDQSSA